MKASAIGLPGTFPASSGGGGTARQTREENVATSRSTAHTSS